MTGAEGTGNPGKQLRGPLPSDNDDFRVAPWPARSPFTCCLLAVALWAGLAVSVGWYYACIRHMNHDWPMCLPTPEAGASLLCYHFAMETSRTAPHVVVWLAAFPMAGMLWVFALSALSPYFRGEHPPFPQTLLHFAMANIPLVILAPWMTYLAGQSRDGFFWHDVLNAANQRYMASPGTWMVPLYLIMAATVLFIQFQIYRNVFHIRGKAAWQRIKMCSQFFVSVIHRFLVLF